MPIIRQSALGKGLKFKCPKCGASINIDDSAFRSRIAPRCGACAYPLILKSDLMLIISECESVNGRDLEKVGSAASILKSLSEFMPEAAVALGRLVGRLPVMRVSEEDRWNALLNAYRAGSGEARELLEGMCRANPGSYETTVCARCGAKKFASKRLGANGVCAFCHSAK